MQDSGSKGRIRLQNWNKTLATQPAMVVKASSVKDVQRVVLDTQAYPSPVSAVGSCHSVTDILVNNEGTVLDVSGMHVSMNSTSVHCKDMNALLSMLIVSN